MPDDKYKQTKRSSVFHKVDINAFNLNTVPKYKKSKKEIQEIVSMMNQNFLSKNLKQEELEKIAGFMEPKVFSKGDVVIKYGDDGMTYYFLSRGSV
jgi:hypothetical protein